jgi:hypothetical protein
MRIHFNHKNHSSDILKFQYSILGLVTVLPDTGNVAKRAAVGWQPATFQYSIPPIHYTNILLQAGRISPMK